MRETEAAAAPTCEAEGKTAVYSCANGCGKTEGGEVIEALGHSWTVSYEWSEDGKSCTAIRSCANDEEHNMTSEATAKGVVAKEATCSSMGDTQYTAVFAADWAETQTTVRTDIAVNRDAHEWGEWKVVKEATYDEKGLKERECKLCDDKEYEDIPKLIRPSEPSAKPIPDATVIIDMTGRTEGESNPNTGAPAMGAFAVAALAAAAAVCGKKCRK